MARFISWNILTVLCMLSAAECNKKPNIIIIMADDLGFNDVSFHGSDEIKTPNIDAMAYAGIILNRFYTPSMCTPSRASLMTGKYPTKIGMQHFVIPSDEPWGVGLEEKLMPQYFKDAGYKTHLVGKWHLGFFQKDYTPTLRGFDTHFGYLGPYIDYYDFTLKMFNRNYSRGYDMRKNLEVNYNIEASTYATDLFADEAVEIINAHDADSPLFLLITHLAPHTGNDDAPLQAPQDVIDNLKHINDPERRVLAAMIIVLDKTVGQIVKAVKNKGILDNTIIVFYSDNGAMTVGQHANKGSNYPLRGQKNSPWEGGIRNVGLIFSPLIKYNQRVIDDWIHVSDLLPTLATAAGISPISNIDGIDHWNSLVTGKALARSEILNNIDTITGYSSYMRNGWKIVNGTTNNGSYDGWLNKASDYRFPQERSYINYLKDKIRSLFSITMDANQILQLKNAATVSCNKRNPNNVPCVPLEEPCLFNIVEDPCEIENLAKNIIFKDKLLEMEEHLKQYLLTLISSRMQPADSKCDPANFNGTWSWWIE